MASAMMAGLAANMLCVQSARTAPTAVSDSLHRLRRRHRPYHRRRHHLRRPHSRRPHLLGRLHLPILLRLPQLSRFDQHPSCSREFTPPRVPSRVAALMHTLYRSRRSSHRHRRQPETRARTSQSLPMASRSPLRRIVLLSVASLARYSLLRMTRRSQQRAAR